MEEEVAGGRDGGMFGTLDLAEGMKLFRSWKVGEFVPDGAANAYGAGELGVGISEGDIFG